MGTVNLDSRGSQHLPSRFLWCAWPLICWVYPISDRGTAHIVWSAQILRHFSVLSVLFLNLNILRIFCWNENCFLLFSVAAVVKADFLGNLNGFLMMMSHLWGILGISIQHEVRMKAWRSARGFFLSILTIIEIWMKNHLSRVAQYLHNYIIYIKIQPLYDWYNL